MREKASGGFWSALGSVVVRAKAILNPFRGPPPKSSSTPVGSSWVKSDLIGAPPQESQLGLSFTTANVSGWGSGKAFLDSCDSHIVCLQEHHQRSKEDLDQASAWALRRGWKSLWVPALPGTNDGTRGGVAVFTRSFLGYIRLGTTS